MTTYSATWTDVPQLIVIGDDLIEVLARTGREYEGMVGEPADDPDYVSPNLSWVVGWDGDKRVMRLRADGNATDVHVCEVTPKVLGYRGPFMFEDDNPWADAGPVVKTEPTEDRCTCGHVRSEHRNGKLGCDYESHDEDGSSFCDCDYFSLKTARRVTEPAGNVTP